MIKIYPTLVDSFRYYLDSETMTLQEMVDRINRKPQPASMPMLKGRAFNDLIDDLSAGREKPVETMVVGDVRVQAYSQTVEYGAGLGMTFSFSKDVADEIAEMVKDSVAQVFTQGKIETSFGEVLIYGYADYLKADTVLELKTGEYYDFPKFLKSFQHKCYLYCLRQEGYETELCRYLFTDFRDVKVEEYYWTEEMQASLLTDLEAFLSFVFSHKDLITDPKILGLT